VQKLLQQSQGSHQDVIPINITKLSRKLEGNANLLHGTFACFRWFCHFDDDNYVNVPRLLKVLDNYNPREDWYLGKPSIPAPLEIVRQDLQKRPVGLHF
jgi:hypothetical protein